MKVDGSFKSLLQGVSQQPPRDRLPGQATLQENMSSDPVQSLTRRPPTDLVGKLGSATTVYGWHNFGTKDGNKFLAWVHDNNIQVFDLNAGERTVSKGSTAPAYLSGPIRGYTNEDDETVLVNTNKTVAMLSAVPTYLNTVRAYGIVQVLGGQYGKTYTIKIDGTTRGTYSTPTGSTSADSPYVDTASIANYLVSSLATNYPTFSYYRVEDIILIVAPASVTQFTLSVGDGYGGVNIKAMTQVIGSVDDLPRFAPHRYVVRVAEKTDPEKDLWFTFIVEGQEANLTPSQAYFGQPGYWQETVAPNVPYKFDQTTMPYILAYDSTTGNFTFDQGGWEDRKVGTLVSNPAPTFVGNRIRDVSSFQGRLVFLAGANVITSRTNKFKDFWFGSASALADTDPIDVNSTVDSSNMISCVQHNRNLVIFSTEAQFVLYGQTKVTPDNAALVLTTKFESEAGAHPVGSGRDVFFATNYGAYTAMREFYADGSTGINDSRPITQHIKRYIVGKATLLTSSINYDTLLVHTDKDRNKVYVYQFIWADNEKVQASWSTWSFGHEIVYSFFDEDRIYLVQKVGNDYFLLRMPMDVQVSDGIPYAVHLDQRFDVSGVDRQFLLPYDYLKDEPLTAVQGNNCPNPGLRAVIQSIVWDAGNSAYRVTLKRSMGGGDIVIGSRYTSAYWPTMPFVKDSDGVVMDTAKLRIKAFILALHMTGHIVGQAVSPWGNTEPVEFNGRILGNIDNIVGEQPLVDENFIMPMRLDVTESEVAFSTDKHMPMTILSIEWLGQYNKKGKRITGGGG